MPNAYLPGIDVSSNQGVIDWDKVAQAGVTCAFARAAIGGHQPDKQFAANWTGMQNAGIIRGAYHFFWPLTPWHDQAITFIDTVITLKSGDLPPALDLEEAFAKSDTEHKHDFWNDVPFAQRLPMIQSWIAAVNDAFGVAPIIYTRQNFIEELLGDGVEQLSGSPLWIAHYDVLQPKFPTAWDAWTFWQFTEKDSVSGVTGKVDGDRFQGSLADLQALTKP